MSHNPAFGSCQAGVGHAGPRDSLKLKAPLVCLQDCSILLQGNHAIRRRSDQERRRRAKP